MKKDFLYILLAGAATGCTIFITYIPIVRADTVVTDGYISVDTVWDREHSPYLLGDVVTVPADTTLRIEPGVQVSVDPSVGYEPYIYVAGTLDISGTAELPVAIDDISGITIDHGRADIRYASMRMKGELMFTGADGMVSSSTISNITDGIYVEGSKVSINNSRIINNARGIVVADLSMDIFPMSLEGSDEDFPAGVGDLDTDDGARPSIVTISNSSITHNTLAVDNTSSVSVEARSNWWGSEEGPFVDDADMILGSVIYEPWLQYDPTSTGRVSCCSNILFIPGLQASRLYRSEPLLGGMFTSENQLWEPNRNADVEKLFLHPDGTSMDPGIIAGDPIGNAYGILSVYDSFMEFLDSLVDEGKISEWKSFGYDWRKPITEVVVGDQLRATTTESLLETVETLATRSQTGKVSIIAHSNGGLVTKYLVKELMNRGKEHLIDSVISVAVPHIGTPQSIPALLHGDNQSILGGLILKKSVAKQLGLNMPSAYTLLPSTTYFSKVLGPTIAYAAGTSSPIDSESEQASFISSRANSFLMNIARGVHTVLDPFMWPMNIARWAIVGWGNMTSKGITYTDDALTEYDLRTTSMGDGTVIAPSAAYNAGTTTAIDLATVSENEDRTIKHSNILEAEATKETIKNIVTAADSHRDAKSIEDALVKIPGVSIGEPDYSNEPTFLVVSTHSPVELHLYDAKGRHSGIAPLPAEIAERVEGGLFTFVEDNIPGSSVRLEGDEEDPETFITIPENISQTYAVNIKGIGIGEFTYRVERIRGSEVLSSVEYSGLPVTPFMIATTTVVTRDTLSQVLAIDTDGNGSVDIVSQPNQVLDPVTFFGSFKSMVVRLIGPGKGSEDLVKRINKIQDVFRKDKIEKIHGEVSLFEKKLGAKKINEISQEDKKIIIEMIEEYVAQFE